MNTCFHALIAFLVFAGSGYLVLRFFSVLSGVDMVAAICWAFRGKTVLFFFPILWCIGYLMIFVFSGALLMKPFHLWKMSRSHDGGLQGYAASAGHAKLYDPRRKEYIDYPINGAPAAVEQFNKTFELITVYKPLQSETYEHIVHQGVFVSVMLTILGGFGLVLTYVAMYYLAAEYSGKQHLVQELSHALVLARFREMTGYPFSLVLTVVLFLVILTSGIGGYLVNRITNDYAEQFSETQKKFREEILYRVKPGMILRGRLVNRREDQHYSESRTNIDDKTEYSSTAIDKTMYTVEFKGIIRSEPVYLSLIYFGTPGDIPDVQFLDRYFPPRTRRSLENYSVTNFMTNAHGAAELDFLVKDDYSVDPVRK